MRAALALALALTAACAGTRNIVRARVVDAETGAPAAGAEVVIETHLVARRSIGFCRVTERSHPLSTRSDGEHARWDIERATVRTDAGGWLSVPVPEASGLCRYEPRSIELRYQKVGIANIDLNARELVVPLFPRGVPPTTNSGAAMFTATRAREAFDAAAAVRSVYAERFIRHWEERDVTIIPAGDGQTFLVGSDPYRSSEAADGGDPWLRVAIATARPATATYRVELRGLEVEARGGAPRYVLPPPFAAQPAAVQAVEAWARQALAELILRSAAAAGIVHPSWRSLLLSGTTVKNRWAGQVTTSEVRATVSGGRIDAIVIGYQQDIIETTTLRATLAGARALGSMHILDKQVLSHNSSKQSADDICRWRAEGAPHAAVFRTMIDLLTAHGGRPDPALGACPVDHPEGCVLGRDREGTTWRGRCWHGDARDHALFKIEEQLARRRFWAQP